MEKLLLHLYQLQDREYSQTELSELLDISQKQLSRLLSRWSAEGILSYTSGRGRGIKTQLTWHKNIDEIYYQQVKQLINAHELEAALPYLSWEWSTLSRQKLITKSNKLLGFNSHEKDQLIINKRYRLLSTHPLESVEAKSASVVMNIYDTLFRIDDHHQVTPHLAHHYVLTDHYIDIYLRKDIYFHDGTILQSDDVITCFTLAKEHINTKDMMAEISRFEKLNSNIIRIHFNNCPEILVLLSTLTLSIYKQAHGKCIGTGPFYIKKDNAYATTLKKFDRYFHLGAHLDEVKFINIPDTEYTRLGSRETATAEITATLGFNYLCRFPESDLTEAQLTFIHHAVQDHYRYLYNNYSPGNIIDPAALSYSRYIHHQQLKRPAFNHPVRLICMDYQEHRIDALTAVFNQFDIPYEIQNIDLLDIVNCQLTIKGDFLMHGEYLDKTEDFSYYNFIFTPISGIYPLLSQYSFFEKTKQYYRTVPYHEWHRLNRLVDRYLEKHNILIPILANNVSLQYEPDLRDIEINQFGFVDFSKIWKI